MTYSRILKRGLMTGALSVVAILAITMGPNTLAPQTGGFGAAYADEEDHASGGRKGGNATAGHHEEEEEDSTEHSGGKGHKPIVTGPAGAGSGAGAGGRAESGGQGRQTGKTSASAGGKPIWAQEGIPEVELGRLNVARSPDRVLDRAYAEAMATLDSDMTSFYSQPYSSIVSDLTEKFREVSYIDSPLQNLSMLRASLDGTLAMPGVSNDPATLRAVFLGVASDKTVPISTDTVVAITAILGTPVGGAEAAALAARAEAVRVAILAGHG